MTTSPFTPTILNREKELKAQRVLGRAPVVLRDGPVPEQFKLIARHWNDAQGVNDGYALWNMASEKRVFAGAQPVIDAFLADNPLADGKEAERRVINKIIKWGHENSGRHIAVEVLDVPIPPPPIDDAKRAEIAASVEAAKQGKDSPVTDKTSELDKPVARTSDNQPRPEADKETCRECKGTGEIERDRCPACGGDGWLWKGEQDTPRPYPRTDGGQPMTDDELADYLIAKGGEKPANGKSSSLDTAHSLGDATIEPDPSHFSADKAWRVEYNKLRSKRLDTATMKDGPFTDMVKELIGIGGKSFKTLTCSGDEALQMIDNALRLKYDKPETENKPTEAPTSPEKDSSAMGVPETQSKPARDEIASVERGKETVADKPVEVAFVKTLPIVAAVAAITTLTGVKIGEIPYALDSKYPKIAYKDIKLDGGRKGTDIGQSFVRDRFDRVFGTHGIGWKFEAHPTIGAVRCEQVTSPDGELKEKFKVTLLGHIFKYRIVLPDGSLEWVELSPMSDSGENRKESYAFRSAFTSLLKQALRSFGGFNHLKAA